MKKQTGFTLIELVMVIVILGILAATFAPKFVDISSDATAAAQAGATAGVKSSHTILIAQNKGALPSVTALAVNTDGATAVATGVAFDIDNDGTDDYTVATLKDTGTGCVTATAAVGDIVCGF